MNRVMIFAYWDKDGVIDDYVLYYLNKAKAIADHIIFSADCEIQSTELPKLDKIVTHTINGRHGEYDFGSYKRGFLYAKENGLLDNADELIFCNDSCFGPFYDFENYFDKIDRTKCDFWGMNFNKQFDNHLGSYFIVFGNKVFTSGAFNDFVNNIKHQADKHNVVLEYEIKMTEYLHKNGFAYSYCYGYPGSFRIYNTIFKEIEKRQYPFFKKSMLVNQFDFIVNWAVNRMKKQIHSEYPFECIKKYYKRINEKTPFKTRLINFLKMWVPYFIILPRVRNRMYLFNRWYEWK
ncbi:MAG: hypothetical protein K6A44_07620 [bacterium]|nr:hypothetical protein [bacterium]